MQNAITHWIQDARTASSTGTDIYMIVPFNYGNGSYTTYKTAYVSGFQDYVDSYPTDTNVYLIDLEAKARETVRDNSTDNLHPNGAGSAILAGLIYDALTPLAIKNLTGTVDTDTGVSLTWEDPDPDTNSIKHINTDYLVEYQTSGASVWTTSTTLP
jgi:hypothetical protein